MSTKESLTGVSLFPFTLSVLTQPFSRPWNEMNFSLRRTYSHQNVSKNPSDKIHTYATLFTQHSQLKLAHFLINPSLFSESRIGFLQLILLLTWRYVIPTFIKFKIPESFSDRSWQCTNVDLKITLYICGHIGTIPWKFRFLNPKNSQFICPWSLKIS